VTFSIELAPGATVEIFGIQAEAQVSPSSYKPTTARSSVFPRSRFDADSLQVVANGFERHSTSIRIVSPLE
jgi:hypothetical protein